MSFDTKPFPPPIEAQFRATRLAALVDVNLTTYWLVAVLVMVFSWWDWFVDPVNWTSALVIRSAGSLVILGSGIVQRVTRRIEWASAIAKTRYAASVLAVASALAVLKDGYVVGLAGLVAVMLAGPYIALDRRDLLKLNVVPLAGIAAIMYAAGLDRFAVVNAAIFIAMAIAISLLLARVFEAANRRAFLLEQALTREARTDALTGLLNRRALAEIAQRELARSARRGAPLSVILCDVDHFKSINDRWGHAAGDRAIRAVGERLHGELRESDAFGRWGGEEFLAILPDTKLDDALVLAERMRRALSASPLPTDPPLAVTVSLGVATRPDSASTTPGEWDTLLGIADEAMYRAKAEGRNRALPARDPKARNGVRGN